MIKLASDNGFTGDSIEFIHNYMNEALKDYLRCLIHAHEEHEDWCPYYYLEDDEPDEFNVTTLDFYFPNNFPDLDELRLKLLKDTYSLLNSDKEYIPTLIMEYILSKIIEAGKIDADPHNGYEPRDTMVNCPFTKKTEDMLGQNYLEFLTELKSEEDYDDTDEEYYRSVDEVIRDIAYFSEDWYDYIFFDLDCLLLDEYTPGELRDSSLNKYAGIMPSNSLLDEYFAPEDWENDKSFHFIKEECDSE